MKTACERCGGELAGEQGYACSFECTFCESCARAMDFVCPNCGGGLKPRLPAQDK